MNTQTLKFGKFKGQRFCDTPAWYQAWLSKQEWFNNAQPKAQPLHKQLAGWDGHSRRGQAVYDQMFEREMQEADLYDPADKYSDEWLEREIAKG